MGKKYLPWLAAGAAVLILLCLLLLPEKTPEGTAAGPRPTHPVPTGSVSVPAQTTAPEETLPPVETTMPAETAPGTTEEPVWTEPEETDPPETEPTEPTEEWDFFPQELEGGKLTIVSLFQYSGMNPDAGYEFGENIAGLQIVNSSEEYLHRAQITVLLQDGRELTFRAEELPPGRTAMAFSLENGTLDTPEQCLDLYGEAEFSEPEEILAEASVNGVEITVKNVSGRDLTDLKIAVHELLDDSYFGGKAYYYTISSLRSGGTATVTAWECILGMCEAVRIAEGE